VIAGTVRLLQYDKWSRSSVFARSTRACIASSVMLITLTRPTRLSLGTLAASSKTLISVRSGQPYLSASIQFSNESDSQAKSTYRIRTHSLAMAVTATSVALRSALIDIRNRKLTEKHAQCAGDANTFQAWQYVSIPHH
jgi:hypothetical protein